MPPAIVLAASANKSFRGTGTGGQLQTNDSKGYVLPRVGEGRTVVSYDRDFIEKKATDS